MKKATISTHNGSGSNREHNMRKISTVSKEKHIKPSGSYEIWRDEPHRDAYKRIFGDALFEYNEKQTRKDRCIKDYYTHIEKDAKRNTVYELIIGVYDKSGNISAEEKKAILKEFVDTWDERNKDGEVGLELIGAYYHEDEEGKDGHVHCTYIGCANGYKKSLRLQSSLDKALTQIGYCTEGKHTAQIQWEAAQNQYLGSLCAKRGILVVHPEGDKKQHLDTATYKAEMQLKELEEKKEQLSLDISSKTLELKEVEKELEREVIKRDTLKAQNSLIEVVQNAYREPERQIEILERQPLKKSLSGAIKRPESVVISADDYSYLNDRVKSGDFVMKALEELKRKGDALMKKVNQNRIIQELQEEIEKLELHLRREESERLKMYNQITDITFWMEKVIDKNGCSLWDYFLNAKMKEKQQSQEVVEREQEEREL